MLSFFGEIILLEAMLIKYEQCSVHAGFNYFTMIGCKDIWLNSMQQQLCSYFEGSHSSFNYWNIGKFAGSYFILLCQNSICALPVQTQSHSCDHVIISRYLIYCKRKIYFLLSGSIIMSLVPWCCGCLCNMIAVKLKKP